jgi:hypothetical protein
MQNNIAQKKIYVDVEEEITTVVENLRRTQMQNIVLVVPQHALLLQSVVNLKLLGQEAKKMQKNIVIMTQDIDGIAFAQRAGISAIPYIADEEEMRSSYVESSEQSHHLEDKSALQKNVQHINAQMRIDQDVQSIHAQKNMEGIRKKNHANNRDADLHKKNGDDPYGVQEYNNIYDAHVEEDDLTEYERSLEKMRVTNHFQQTQQSMYQPQQRQVGTVVHPTQQKDSFTQYSQNNAAPTHSPKERLVSGQRKKMKKMSHGSYKLPLILKAFVFSGLFIIAILLFLLVLPKTHISITPKNIDINEKMQLTVRSDQSAYDVDRRLIPARFIEREVSFTKTFASTGEGDVSAQKAQGTITIYNEHSEESQPLVATTRFLAEDGTLFRLVKQTTVPGMQDGEPGKVEALVIADKEGDDGNIGPQRFSVPGFDGSPKKDKFYGVSEKAMVGGGSDGKGVALVTQEDIESAEATMKNEVDSYIREQIAAVLRPDSEILLPEAVDVTALRSEASVSSGTMGEDFMYEIVSKVRAIVFVQGDVLAVVQSGIDDEMTQYNVDQAEMTLSYNVDDVDFDNETLQVSVDGKADIVAVVDVENFKKDIIGKSHDELLPVIEGSYKDQIEKITIENVFPGFPAYLANRISRFGFMTNAEVVE